MFSPAKSLLRKASRKGYAVPAFNTSNLEVTAALFEAAEKAKSPLMIQTTESSIRYAGFENLFSIISTFEKRAGIPVCIHLDHGKDMNIIKKSLKFGYKSIMIDASKYSFKKNIAITKRVVAMAKRKGCSVEAEIGTLGRPGKGDFTVPDEACEFVERTGCDSLAVAIGTSHGAHKFKGTPKLDLQRLKQINEVVSIPLVLHGASSVPKGIVNNANRYGAAIKRAKGVPEGQIKKAIKLGIAKINLDTDLRLAFTASLREFLKKNPSQFDPRKYLASSEDAVKELALGKMALFGSRGKAR